MSREETPLDRVLAALTAPAHPSELRDKEKVLAAFREAAARPAPQPAPRGTRAGGRARLLTVRAGIAALCATLLGGGVAVATGAGLPLGEKKEARSSSDRAPELSRKQAPAPVPASSTARPSPTDAPRRDLATACRKILREKRENREKKEHRWRPGPAELRDPGFAALAKAAGGPDRVYAYCLRLRSGDSRPGDRDRPGGRPGEGAGPRGDRPWDRDRPSARPSAKPDRPSAGPERPGASDKPRPRPRSDRD